MPQPFTGVLTREAYAGAADGACPSGGQAARGRAGPRSLGRSRAPLPPALALALAPGLASFSLAPLPPLPRLPFHLSRSYLPSPVLIPPHALPFRTRTRAWPCEQEYRYGREASASARPDPPRALRFGRNTAFGSLAKTRSSAPHSAGRPQLSPSCHMAPHIPPACNIRATSQVSATACAGETVQTSRTRRPGQ